jgi:hypothetical protein
MNWQGLDFSAYSGRRDRSGVYDRAGRREKRKQCEPALDNQILRFKSSMNKTDATKDFAPTPLASL